MADAEPRQIEWGSAQIEGGALTVDLSGRATKAWRASFERVLALLETPHHDWGRVRVTKHGIEVDGVQPGSESELRYFLESIILQANSDTVPETSPADAERGEPDPDEEMTRTFRGFAASATSTEGATPGGAES